MDGRAYLAKFIDDRLAAGRGQPEEGRRLSFDLSEIRGVAIGLVAAGALGQEEMERVIADLETSLERLGWLTRVEARASAEDPVGVSADSWMPLSAEARRELALKKSLERRHWQEPVIDPPVLRDVIPLAGRTLTVGAVTASLISLERWSTMFVLRLAYADPDHRRLLNRMQTGHVRWRGWDDAGTQYQRRGGSGGLKQGLSIEDLVFEPGAPDEARSLTLCVDHDSVTARLTVTLDTGTGQIGMARGGSP
jgi:hypothetical protein